MGDAVGDPVGASAHLALLAAWRNLEASQPLPGFFALGISNCAKWHDLQGYTLFDMLSASDKRSLHRTNVSV
eukprot:scaffold1823_cov108-Cylindrotheca_fusiformis.AAC.1